MKAFNFGQILHLSISDPTRPGNDYVEDEDFHKTQSGAQFRIPAASLLQLAIISADDPAGVDVQAPVKQPDFSLDRATALLDQMTVFTVKETRGKVPSGTLPITTVQAESTTAGSDADPGAADAPYHAFSVIEAKSSYSNQLVLEAGRNVDIAAFVEESHRQSIRLRLLGAILKNGTAIPPLVNGIASLSNIGEGTYPTLDRGKESFFTVAESAVEDADSNPTTTAWLLGKTLHDSAKGALLEPGSDRRVTERARMSLSGYPVYRAIDLMENTTGILADWASIALVLQGDINVTVDAVTRPGTVRITSRLTMAPPIGMRPGRIYILTEA